MLATFHPDRPAARVEVDVDDPEVCATEIKCQEMPFLSARWQSMHIRYEALDIGSIVSSSTEAPVDGIQHPLLNVQQVGVGQVEPGH